MTNHDIFAINASIITDENIWLAEISGDDEINRFFNVLCECDDEWHLMIDRSNLQWWLGKKNDERHLQYREEIEMAEQLDTRIDEIAAHHKISKDQVMELTWVW